MSISDRLDEIQARADKALAGPWEVNPFAHSVRKSGTNKVVCRLSVLDNASFIAHARTDVPALVAAVRAVLDRHKPVQHRSGTTICNGCWGDDDGELAAVEHPCPTVRAIATALREGQ